MEERSKKMETLEAEVTVSIQAYEDNYQIIKDAFTVCEESQYDPPKNKGLKHTQFYLYRTRRSQKQNFYVCMRRKADKQLECTQELIKLEAVALKQFLSLENYKDRSEASCKI